MQSIDLLVELLELIIKMNTSGDESNENDGVKTTKQIFTANLDIMQLKETCKLIIELENKPGQLQPTHIIFLIHQL